MKKKIVNKFSTIFLNILLIFLGLGLILFILGSAATIFTGKGDLFTLRACISFITCILYFLITYNLRKVVYSMDLTPFCYDNVKRFRSIGYFMLCIAIFDAIVNFKVPSNLTILTTEYGSLKGSFFIYISLTCIAFILAEIFEKAIEIKKENDLTV